MAKLNIGIIGAGMIAEKHIQSLQLMKAARVSWLADLDAKLLKSVLIKYKIPNGTNDYHKILEDQRVQAVYICVTGGVHI